MKNNTGVIDDLPLIMRTFDEIAGILEKNGYMSIPLVTLKHQYEMIFNERKELMAKLAEVRGNGTC